MRTLCTQCHRSNWGSNDSIIIVLFREIFFSPSTTMMCFTWLLIWCVPVLNVYFELNQYSVDLCLAYFIRRQTETISYSPLGIQVILSKKGFLNHWINIARIEFFFCLYMNANLTVYIFNPSTLFVSPCNTHVRHFICSMCSYVLMESLKCIKFITYISIRHISVVRIGPHQHESW